MRKRTASKQLQQAITDGLLIVIKTETYDKESGRTEMIDSDTFKESWITSVSQGYSLTLLAGIMRKALIQADTRLNVEG